MPILLTQNAAFTGTEINILIWATSPGYLSCSIPVKIVLKHTPLWDTTPYKPIVASYLYGTSTPTAFVVVPPKEASPQDQPPILSLRECLHVASSAPLTIYSGIIDGAGVDIIRAQEFVPPRHERSWTIAPTGRTEWARPFRSLHMHPLIHHDAHRASTGTARVRKMPGQQSQRCPASSRATRGGRPGASRRTRASSSSAIPTAARARGTLSPGTRTESSQVWAACVIE